jgi:hypothetical protein
MLLLALAALLAVGIVAVDSARFAGAPEATVDAPATLQRLLEEGSQERHALYAYLRSEAPGARVVIDAADPAPNVAALSLRTLGAVGAVERQPIGEGTLGAGGWIPNTPPDVNGRLRAQAWELHREPGTIDTVLVGRIDDRTIVVDRRSVPALAVPVWDEGTTAPQAPALVRAVTGETLLLLGLVLLGGLVLPRPLGPRAARPALALLAGAAVQAVTGYLFLAGIAAMGAGVVLAFAVNRWLRTRGSPSGWARDDLPALLATTVIIALTALVVRLEGLVVVTSDAIAHVVRAIALGDGLMGLADLNEKRPLALAAINAPAHALGVEGLHSFGWIMLVASGVLLAALPLALRQVDGRSQRIGAIAAGAAALAFVVQVPLLRTMAAFLNTHLLVAALLLLLVVLWVHDGGEVPRRDLVPIGTITLLALIPTRAESVLVVGLVLLATLAVGRDRPTWPWAWVAVGGGLAAWNGLHVVSGLMSGTQPSFPVTALTVVGIGTLLALPVLSRLSASVRRTLARATMAAFWLLVVGLLSSVIGSGAGALEGLRVNLGEGEGAWGVFAPVLLVLVVLALVAGSLRMDRRLVLVRWLVLGAVPSVLLAKAADGTEGAGADEFGAALDTALTLGARIGSWGDSANRMWVHFVLVALAYVAMTAVVALRGDGSEQEGAGTPSDIPDGAHDRATGLRPVAVLLVGGAVLAMLLPAWSPTYLGPVAPATTVSIVQVDPGDAGVPGTELVAGVRRESRLTTPALDLPDDARDVTVCARLRFTDLGRIVTTTTHVGLEVSGATVRRTFSEFAWSGEWIEELCVDAPDLSERPAEVLVWAEGGDDATAGESAVIMAGGELQPVDAIEVRYVSLSEDERSVSRRVVSIVLRAAIGSGPWLVAGFGMLGLFLLLSGSSRANRVLPRATPRG